MSRCPSTTYKDATHTLLKDCNSHNRPSTVKGYKHYLDTYVCKKRVADITRGNIQKHLERYQDKPSGYSHSLTEFKIFFNWCLRQEIIDRNPVAGERAISIPSRDRVLTPEELVEVWASVFVNIVVASTYAA